MLTFTYLLLFLMPWCWQVERQRMDDALQSVLAVVPTVPHPPTRKSSRQVPSLSQSSSESSDSQPGSSAAGLDPSPQRWGKDLGQVAPLASTVEIPLEGERGFGGSRNVSHYFVHIRRNFKRVRSSHCNHTPLASSLHFSHYSIRNHGGIAHPTYLTPYICNGQEPSQNLPSSAHTCVTP